MSTGDCNPVWHTADGLVDFSLGGVKWLCLHLGYRLSDNGRGSFNRGSRGGRTGSGDGEGGYDDCRRSTTVVPHDAKGLRLLITLLAQAGTCCVDDDPRVGPLLVLFIY